MASTDVVQAAMGAFLAQDRATAERLLADDFAYSAQSG